MDICKKLGQNVKRLRELVGVSQEELGFKSDLHRTYVSAVERGVRNPTIKVVEKLAKGLETTPDELLK